MPKDPRDVVWEATCECRYFAYYQELCFRELIRRWTLVDRSTKIAVGLTSASSVIAGYALWQQEGWRSVWMAIAGTAAVLSIVNSSLSVADTIKRYTEMLSKLVSLRIDLEDLMHKMDMAPEFDTKKIEIEYQCLRDRYKAVSAQPVSDVLFTKKLSAQVQDHLDSLLIPAYEQKSKSACTTQTTVACSADASAESSPRYPDIGSTAAAAATSAAAAKQIKG